MRWLEQIRQVQDRFVTLAKFKVRLPPSAPVMFHIENTHRHLREFVARCARKSMSRPRSTDEVVREIDEKKSQIAAAFVQLETSSALLQSTNEEHKQEVDKVKPARAEIDKLRTRGGARAHRPGREAAGAAR
jgi:5'-deoxynucleotidase YfbR-like HD superfamily hydrolase